ncbi:hypothetical protein [Azospirillum melinis]
MARFIAVRDGRGAGDGTGRWKIVIAARSGIVRHAYFKYAEP